ncbi:MAG: hypothetical protein HWE39_09325 [Oceanospirillaceae bacterium]|nr:hypothetical protein [Oceanospirillaceae bacterium]
MENKDYILRERRKIKELAREYEEQGYQVLVEPSRNDLPEFLENYQPDLILKKGNLNIVVEVKTSATIRNSEYLKELSSSVNSHENWKFELVLTNPRKKETLSSSKYQEFEIPEIEKRLKQLNEFRSNSFIEPYFLYAWSLLEATARIILKTEQPKIEIKLNPVSIIKQLFSYGIIGRLDYEWLNRMINTRNHLAHGHETQGIKIDSKDLDKMTRMIEDFLKEIKTVTSKTYKQ